MRSTVNQIILLLEIARGTFSESVFTETQSADLITLAGMGLIVATCQGEDFIPTENGLRLAQKIIEAA